MIIAAAGVRAQDASPSVVQPGAPGQPTRILAPSTRAVLPMVSAKDIEFMQGMIMHHAQAVEMTAMIAERTENPNVRRLGERISSSQEDEIAFMRRWLAMRGQPETPATPGGHGHTAKPGSPAGALMPGMLSPEQMESLRKARGAEFDRLFLEGMIRHHLGALDMVKDLFDTAGSGQDAELFNFASDVDTGQRAEIKTMETLLGKRP